MVKLVDKTMQSNYSCVILHIEHKNINSHCFYLVEKIQDGGQDGGQDGNHVW